MKPSNRTIGSTLVAEPPADEATMFWRWAVDYVDGAIAQWEPGSRVAEGPSALAGEAWSMVWQVDAGGSTVAADLRDPCGREWRYDRSAAGSTLAVDVSDFRFIDQAE
jgi:hypothetical protein